MRANRASQYCGRGSIPVQLRRIFVDKDFTINMIADRNPGAVDADTDPIGNLERALNDNSIVSYLD
jgi:hypothetical protein